MVTKLPYFAFRWIRATKNSLDGIEVLWKKEQSFRQEVAVLSIALPIITFLHIPSELKLLLVLLLILVLVVEAINSAVETVVDRISTEIHAKSRIAKDMGSSAVCITIMMNVIAWVYVIYYAFFG